MMILRLDELPNDAFSESEEVLKYFKDLKIMMEGILDLNRRGSLPELEKATTVTLLLKITLKVDTFGDLNISESKMWLSMLEGSRKRTGRSSFQRTFTDKVKMKEDSKDHTKSKGQSVRPTISKRSRGSNAGEPVDISNVKKRKKRKDDGLMNFNNSTEFCADSNFNDNDFSVKRSKKSDGRVVHSSATVLLQQQILRGPVNRVDNLYMEEDDDECDPYKTHG